QHAYARFQSRRVLAVMLGGAAIVTLGFWLAFAWTRSPMVLYGLYVWVGLYTITQAKRVYAFIGAGGVLGAVVGSGVARGVTALAESRHLILAACVPLLASCVASVVA